MKHGGGGGLGFCGAEDLEADSSFRREEAVAGVLMLMEMS